jgi:hypothetical protein
MIFALLFAACMSKTESDCLRMCDTYWNACQEAEVQAGTYDEIYTACSNECSTYESLSVREQETMAEYAACADDWIADVEKYDADGESCNDECGVRSFSAAALEGD